VPYARGYHARASSKERREREKREGDKAIGLLKQAVNKKCAILSSFSKEQCSQEPQGIIS